MVAKVVIALVAFPVLVHAVFTGSRLLLDAMLPAVLPLAGGWAEIVGKGVVVLAFLIAVRLAFGVCRWMWPAPALK